MDDATAQRVVNRLDEVLRWRKYQGQRPVRMVVSTIVQSGGIILAEKVKPHTSREQQDGGKFRVSVGPYYLATEPGKHFAMLAQSKYAGHTLIYRSDLGYYYAVPEFIKFVGRDIAWQAARDWMSKHR